MGKKTRYDELANRVIGLIGGENNISLLAHCVTRLRFDLKDKSLVNLEEIEKIAGVIGVKWQNDQLQIIVGQNVGEAYKAILEKNDLGSYVNTETIDTQLQNKKKISIGSFFDGIAGSIVPLIPVLIGAGMLKVILLIAQLTGILTAESDTFIMLSFAGDAAFYFLPIMVGSTAAKKFKTNQGLGMLLGAILVFPAFMAAIDAGTNLSIFGLPVYAANYANSIFPVIISVYIMSKIEPIFEKYSPELIKSITHPLLTILVMVPLTYCLLGPVGAVIGNYISDGVMWLYNTVGFLGTAILATIQPLLIMTGMHTAFTPFMIQTMSSIGIDPIVFPSALINNMNQATASLVVGIKTKDKKLKSTAISCALTAYVSGVTEPALFGINLRLKKPLYGAMIGSFCGGLFAGITQVKIFAFPGSAGLLSLPAFIGDSGLGNLYYAVIALIIGTIVTFIATFFLYQEDKTGLPIFEEE